MSTRLAVSCEHMAKTQSILNLASTFLSVHFSKHMSLCLQTKSFLIEYKETDDEDYGIREISKAMSLAAMPSRFRIRIRSLLMLSRPLKMQLIQQQPSKTPAMLGSNMIQ
jgi:hypothetical protein